MLVRANASFVRLRVSLSLETSPSCLPMQVACKLFSKTESVLLEVSKSRERVQKAACLTIASMLDPMALSVPPSPREASPLSSSSFVSHLQSPIV